jgi:carbon storage regulator CsrA
VLVLTRRANQSIMIGDNVVVTVLDVRGDQVRIGIKAPRSVDVHREEVFVALQRDGGGDHIDPASDPTPDRDVAERDVIDLDHIDAVSDTTAPVVAAPE